MLDYLRPDSATIEHLIAPEQSKFSVLPLDICKQKIEAASKMVNRLLVSNSMTRESEQPGFTQTECSMCVRVTGDKQIDSNNVHNGFVFRVWL